MPRKARIDAPGVVHGHGAFPSIDGPDESFDPEGRVTRIVEKKGKSILCEEDCYLKELVSYIRLDPLRAKVVDDSQECLSFIGCVD